MYVIRHSFTQLENPTDIIEGKTELPKPDELHGFDMPVISKNEIT
jgi:hypothetical protein